MRNKLGVLMGLFALLHLTAAQAYIGPGAGAGTFAIVLGILSSIFFAFVGILWYPIKRLLKGLKKISAKTSTEPGSEPKDSGSGS